MKILIKSLLFVIGFTFLLTGCWDLHDIKDRNIASLVITDYKNGEYGFIIEVANIKGAKSSTSGLPSKSFSISNGTGKSFPETRENIDRKSDSPIFLGAVRGVVITKSLAEYGIEDYMNRIRGTIEYRKSIDIVTTSSNPDDMLKIKPENDISVGFSIEDTIQSNYDLGMTIHVTIGDILQAISLKKVAFVTHNIIIESNENTLDGLSIFKDSKMIGSIPANESMGLVYFLRNNAKFVYDIENNKNILTVKVEAKKRKIVPSYDYSTKKIKLKIQMDFEAKVLYINKLFKLDKKKIDEYKKKLTEILYKKIKKAIDDSQKKYACDYLEIFKEFRIYYPKVFETIKWNESYSKAEVELSVNAEIKQSTLFDFNPKIK